MKKFITGAVLALGLTASTAVLARQTQQTPTPQGEQGQADEHSRRGRMRHRMKGMRHRMRAGREGFEGLRRLSLTDAQREQFRALREATRQRTQAQREELRQIFRSRREGGNLTAEQEARARQLHQELRETHQRLRTEMLNALTTEQRTQLEQLKQEREQRREN